MDNSVKRKTNGYWEWVFKRNRINEEGEYVESLEANPDITEEGKHLWDLEKDEEQEFNLKELFKKVRFSPLEARVASLFLKGHTENEVAKLLGIKRFTVSSIRFRLQKKIKKVVCQNPDYGASVRGIID